MLRHTESVTEQSDTRELLIRDVSDTALWAAVFRARESERADALFRDPYAKRLAGARGEQITDELQHAGEHSWAWVMRTYLFDQIIQTQIDAGIELVINLAAGLDARPYRMELPSGLEWVEVDLPHLNAYKAEILSNEKPVCRLERINLDLRDKSKKLQVFTTLAARGKRALILSEALLIYLSMEENAALAAELFAHASFEHWGFDLVSPSLLEMLRQTTGQHTEIAGAPYQFGPDDGPKFFAPSGWKAESSRSIFQAAVDAKRLPEELQWAAGYVEPAEPWTLPIMWSGICLMRRSA